MEEHKIDTNFSGRLNILRAGVLGANDGIISIAGVVIGVASATDDVWIIFLSGLAAVFAGAFSMFLFLPKRIQKKLLLPESGSY